MKKVFFFACVFTMIFTFAISQAMAADQQKGAQTGQSSQMDKQDQKAGAAGQSTMGRSGQPLAGSQQNVTQVSRISELMDKKVKDQQGQDLGQIEDMVVTKDGRISYIILSRGGVMGVGEKMMPVPFKNAQINEDTVVLSNIDKQKLENAPTFSKNDWQRLSDPGFENELFSYYGQQSGQERTQPGMSPGASGTRQPGSGGVQQPSQQSPMQQRPGQDVK